MRLGFLGGGRMAQAIISGLLANKFILPQNIFLFDINPSRMEFFQNMQISVTPSRSHLLKSSDTLILAVKPDQLSSSLKDIHHEYLFNQPLIVSICAGITLSHLQSLFPDQARILRVMANTPCLVGESSSVISPAQNVAQDEIDKITSLFSALGIVLSLPEKFLDIVTGLSGSGPAFVFTFIESLTDAGVLHGLPRHIARQLASQTVLGSAKMAIQYPELHLAHLRNQVESPGGTTIAGSVALEKLGFRNSIISAVSKATQRSKKIF